MTPSASRITRFVVAGLVGLTACSGESSPTAVAAPTRASLALGDVGTNATPEFGKIKVCKSSSSNVSGSFAIARTAVGTTSGTALTTATATPGNCVTVAEDFTNVSGNGSYITVTESSAGFVSVSAQRIDDSGTGPVVSTIPGYVTGTQIFLNSFHGYTITYVNNVETPPPALCDFITFGRLVTEVNGQKVVISGNAGGNQPGGGILGEFHIEANGVDNHVAVIDSYGPITSGALSGPSYPNARVVTGTAKNGVKVELRLWDGGEPGKNTDVVWVKLNGVVTLPTNTIDQGNMQYHPQCRGPK